MSKNSRLVSAFAPTRRVAQSAVHKRRKLISKKSVVTEASTPGLSLDESVYGRIKDMILTNKYKSGQKLPPQHIADLLNVSRTPVRQALDRLYQENYVIRIPDRGFFVAEIDSHEARDLYDVRAALECFALDAAMARGRIGKKELQRLIDLEEAYYKHVESNAIVERVTSDRDFHIYLASLSGNQYLIDTLTSVFERIIMIRRIDGYWSSERRGKAVLKEHEALLSAIRSGRREDARRILDSHLREAWVQYEAHLLQLAVP